MVILIDGDMTWLRGSLGGIQMVAGEVLNHRSTYANGYRILTIFYGVQTTKDVVFRANEGTTLAKMLGEHHRQLLRDIMASALLRARSFCLSISMY